MSVWRAARAGHKRNCVIFIRSPGWPTGATTSGARAPWPDEDVCVRPAGSAGLWISICERRLAQQSSTLCSAVGQQSLYFKTGPPLVRSGAWPLAADTRHQWPARWPAGISLGARCATSPSGSSLSCQNCWRALMRRLFAQGCGLRRPRGSGPAVWRLGGSAAQQIVGRHCFVAADRCCKCLPCAPSGRATVKRRPPGAGQNAKEEEENNQDFKNVCHLIDLGTRAQAGREPPRRAA